MLMRQKNNLFLIPLDLKSFISFLILLISLEFQAQEQGKSYNDGHGGKVYLPLGDRSFADEVVTFTMGDPAATELSSNPSLSLGVPDFDGTDKGFVSLGCGGTLILKFKDNALIDTEGPDLFVFEMGKYIESTDLAISKDGITWISIGEIKGAKAEIDIREFIKEGDVFNYVRLIDLKSGCKGSWSGADIDAVAAIGSAKRISFTGSVLFTINESVLKPEAKKTLEDLVQEIKDAELATILVEGYTDSLGTTVFNKKLSLARAAAVKDFLQQKLSAESYTIEARGFGEINPLFPNDIKEGQEKNRRVEIILLPKGK